MDRGADLGRIIDVNITTQTNMNSFGVDIINSTNVRSSCASSCASPVAVIPMGTIEQCDGDTLELIGASALLRAIKGVL